MMPSLGTGATGSSQTQPQTSVDASLMARELSLSGWANVHLTATSSKVVDVYSEEDDSSFWD